MDKDSRFKILPIAVFILLLYALLDMPYYFYFILKIAVFLSSIVFAYLSFRGKKILLSVLFIVIIIVYNPFYPLYTNRDYWFKADLISAIIFLLYIVGLPTRKTKELHKNLYNEFNDDEKKALIAYIDTINAFVGKSERKQNKYAEPFYQDMEIAYKYYGKIGFELIQKLHYANMRIEFLQKVGLSYIMEIENVMAKQSIQQKSYINKAITETIINGTNASQYLHKTKLSTDVFNLVIRIFEFYRDEETARQAKKENNDFFSIVEMKYKSNDYFELIVKTKYISVEKSNRIISLNQRNGNEATLLNIKHQVIEALNVNFVEVLLQYMYSISKEIAYKDTLNYYNGYFNQKLSNNENIHNGVIQTIILDNIKTYSKNKILQNKISLYQHQKLLTKLKLNFEIIIENVCSKFKWDFQTVYFIFTIAIISWVVIFLSKIFN